MVAHCNEEGVLNKKGNMALKFSDASTCQDAKEYVEKICSKARRECREMSRR